MIQYRSDMEESCYWKKKMSREYMIFDKSGRSEKIILFHVRDFIISAYEIDGLHPEGNGFKEAMALGVGALENVKLLRSVGFQNILQSCDKNMLSSFSIPLLEEVSSKYSSFSCGEVIVSMAHEIQQQQEKNIPKIYNENKFGNLSMPLLEKESSKNSSFLSSEVIASMAYNEIQQELQVEMTDEEGSNCFCGEEGDELDALLNLGNNLDDTADSMEVGEHSSQRIKEPFEKLRNIVGGECMDPVDVLDEAIQYVKRLEMDLKKLKDM